MGNRDVKKSLLLQSIAQKDNGTFALDKMYEYQQYHGINQEISYVLRGSVIGCQYGTELSLLDMKRDYGVYRGELPVMTCADYKPENIYGFGSCLCPEKKYAGCVPMNPGADSNGEKAVKLPENEYAHICVPRIRSGWKQAEQRTMIYTGEEGYVPALTDQAFLVCQYGGMIEVKSVPHVQIPKLPPSNKPKIIKILRRESEWLRKKQRKYTKYVTKKDLKALGWTKIRDYYVDKKTGKRSDWLDVYQKDGTFKPDPEIEAHYRKIANQDIVNLNRVLTHYNITTYVRICSFMAQITHECGAGEQMCEGTGTKAHPLNISSTRSNMTKWYYKYNMKDDGKTLNYPFQYRGGGTIQLTHKENYEYVAGKIGDTNIKSGTEYLAFNYPWLCAGVFWEWKKVNEVEDNFKKITYRINGGYKHYGKRKAIYNNCLKVFKRFKKK